MALKPTVQRKAGGEGKESPPAPSASQSVAPNQTAPDETKPLADRIPSGIPSAYADQVIDIVYGVHTSKIVFGIENGSGGVRPVGVAILPTASLLSMANNVVRDLTSPSIVEETAQRLGGVIAMMRGATSNDAAGMTSTPASGEPKPRRRVHKP